MGYALTNILIFGVEIDEETAEKLSKEKFPSCHNYYRPRSKEGLSSIPQEIPVSQYKQHDIGCGGLVFNAKMWAENTDSRIHSLEFQSGHKHYVGIYIASKGYAYHDNLKLFTKKVPPEAIINFELAILPLLEKYNIKEKPTMHTITQVW